MDKAKIKSTILQVAGNPTSGVIAELADELAQAIMDIEKPEVKLSMWWILLSSSTFLV